MFEGNKLEGIVLISSESKKYLNERHIVAYESARKQFIKWLIRMGKDEEKLEGYAQHTAKIYAAIHDKFLRQIWEQQDGYTLNVSHDQAERYLRELVLSDEEYSRSHLDNTKLALQAFFRYQDNDWDPDITISSRSGASQPKDFVSEDERRALREAVLEYDSVPAYAGLSPEQRTKWKRHLARRYGKPMNEVGKEDWDRANGFKYVSIVNSSLDAGLRPVEVGRARTYWVDVENEVLRIPEDESSKNNDNWTVSLREETTRYLGMWLKEREIYEKYHDTDALWLTRHGNPYNPSSLKVLLDNLCEIAEIGRDISWYTIRHSTGTYMAREEGLAAAQSQLRHKSVETTMKYDQAPPEDRRDALDRMG